MEGYVYTEIPAITKEIIKRNAPEATEDEIPRYLDTIFDIRKLPKLTDEDKAVELIKRVIDRNLFILVIVDFDSDGLNSGAVAHKALKMKSNNYRVIHNKRCDHNGFNPKLVARIKMIHDKTPISLIITGDHASNDGPAFTELKAYGVKHVIVTDHHDITNGVGPESVDVFINPQKAEGDPIGMCGAYVIFKVLSNLYLDDTDEYIYNNLYKPCLPHVAIATVTDVMSLDIWYNRVAVRAGLQIMNMDDRGLWHILADYLNIADEICYKDIGFVLGPFINTGNRTSREELYFNILITEDLNKLEVLIAEGSVINKQRKIVRKESFSAAMAEVGENVGNSIALIVDTPMAINGIIAGSLGEAHQVPATCFILDKSAGVLSGSARATLDHIHIANIFKEMSLVDKDLFIACGGHQGAGGCAIKLENFNKFKTLFDKIVTSIPKPEDSIKKDTIIDFNTKYLNYGIVEDINHAGPYGKNWDIPKFRGKFKVTRMILIGMMGILTLKAYNGKDFKCTYFYKSKESNDSVKSRIHKGSTIMAIFEPQYYRRNNRISLTMLIHDMSEV